MTTSDGVEMAENKRAAQSGQHTVLLVEDQPPVRGLLTEALETAGYHVVEAWNGAHAIEAVEQQLPPNGDLCLIVLDMFLPYVNGLEVLQHLAGRGIYVPVVAVSAHHDVLEAARTAGVQGALAKPFELDELLAAVDRLCPRSTAGG